MRATLAASAWLACAVVACAGRPVVMLCGAGPSPSPPHWGLTATSWLRPQAPKGGARLADPIPGTLRDVAGKEWVLRSWDADEAAPREPKVTLAYKDDRFTGRSGCNQYFAEVAPGAEAGHLTVGAVAATRMACAQPIMVVETRFQQQLGKVTRFALRDGTLSLVYTKSDTTEGTMLFDPAENASLR